MQASRRRPTGTTTVTPSSKPRSTTSPRHSTKSRYTSQASATDSALNSTPVHIYCQICVALFLMITLVYMLLIDSHSPIHDSHRSHGSSQFSSSLSNLITSDEEIMASDHFNSARLRPENAANLAQLREKMKGTPDDVHIIFSSGCSEYQNWQVR